jgi:hypothetical protein
MERAKAWQVYSPQMLGMLYPKTAVPRAILVFRPLKQVEDSVIGSIADRVDGHLQASFVGARDVGVHAG